jgi:hypothetical protein
MALGFRVGELMVDGIVKKREGTGRSRLWK